MIDRRLLEKMVKETLSDDRNVLTEPEVKRLLKGASIRTTVFEEVEDVRSAVEAAARIGYPVVLKAVSSDLTHKSDFGGVILDIKDASELEERWPELILNMAENAPTARIEGFIVEGMLPRGVEVIAGAIRDPQFGPVVMFGTGGVSVELFKDVAFRLAPLSMDEAREMIRDVKGFPLLSGYRGAETRDIDAVAEVLVRLGEIMVLSEGIRELEINPLIVYREGAIAADARAVAG